MKRSFCSILNILLVCILISSCSSGEKNSEELYKDCAPGVVLILNQYYYKLTFPSGKSMYFSDIKEGELSNITFDINEIQKHKSMAFGTGFFISEDGKILTNKHVISPQINITDMKGGVRQLLYDINNYFTSLQNELDIQYQTIQQQMTQNYNYDEWGNYVENQEANAPLNEQIAELKQSYLEIEEYKHNLDNIDINDITCTSECELGVAYHNTFVTSSTDFKKCVIIKESNDTNVDLAVAQLTDKITPSNAHIFSIMGDNSKNNYSFFYRLSHLFNTSNDNQEKLKINQALFMIGYNQGIQLATTSQGIKAQITSGNISQDLDDSRLMYTISTLPGSSGSPVLNNLGEVVAVNFAGLANTQNFNFGIPANQIRKFINN